MDTPFTKLYYYVFTSDSTIDKAIRNAIQHKKIFSERRFGSRFMPSEQEKCDETLDRKYGVGGVGIGR